MVDEQFTEADGTGQHCSPANIRCGIISANSRACSLYCPAVWTELGTQQGCSHNTGSTASQTQKQYPVQNPA